jgi:sarcosine oxidase
MHDFAVVGLGAAGSAICLELARRGADVVGMDRFAPPHGRGSSHGRTRIIREAYFEHPLYVPLVQRAMELWTELEELTGTVLYRQTGGLMIGPPEGVLVRGALESARQHGLEHELLEGDGVRRRFPGLLPAPGHAAVLEPRAGVLAVEAALRTLLELARGHGAHLRTQAPVRSWQIRPDGSVLLRAGSEVVHARQAVLAPGPWLNALLAAEEPVAAAEPAAVERAAPPGGRPAAAPAAAPRAVQLPLTVERQSSHWFAPAPGVHAFGAGSCPIAIWEYDAGRFFYTFPDMGHGIKAGIHHEGATTQPDTVDREVGAAEEARVRRLLDDHMPGSAHRSLDAAVCLYTNTPDGHFIVDRHPRHPALMLVSACSGHGFKFAPALGEAVADLLLAGGSMFDLEPFRLEGRWEDRSR